MTVQFQLQSSPIDVLDCIRAVSTDSSGGIDVFIGTVRNHTDGRKVQGLEFEAYEPMAIREMQRIADYMVQNWPLTGIVARHRTGWVEVGEAAVVIAVSAAHRAAAFDACRYAMDALKAGVPIWKKEVFEDGAVWVSAHP